MSSHVVTFCNAGRPVLALIEAGVIARTIVVPTARPGNGTVGVAVHEGRCYVGLQTAPSAVAVLDASTFELERVMELPEVRDLHGLAVHDGDLLLASTGSDQIMTCSLSGERVRPLWSHAAVGNDTIHVNDVASGHGRVLASCFGPRSPGGMRDGTVFDATTGEVLVARLREPHSVVIAAEGFRVLESATGDLVLSMPRVEPLRTHGIAGYARGLALGGTTIAIGRSGYRGHSRRGIGDARLLPLAPTAAVREALYMSGVFFVARKGGAASFVDTTAIAPEIYGVVERPETG